MAFDLKSFALQVRPSQRRRSPDAFNNSIFDAGSPQYVRPEDMLLDIQQQLFDIPRLKSREDLEGIHHADFHKRWLKYGATNLRLLRIGNVEDQNLASAASDLLRCPRRKGQDYPVLLPAVPALAFYKNITHNLPNYWNDQLRPALSFSSDEATFKQRVSSLKHRICCDLQPCDSLKHLAIALLPPPTNRSQIKATDGRVAFHDGPLLRAFTESPNRVLPVCSSLAEALDDLVSLEPVLPRILWAQWLVGLLRLWLPMFFLRRCAITSCAVQTLKSVLKSSTVPSAAAITSQLLTANGVLRGCSEWLNQLAPIIQNYVRARFEMSILLELSNLQHRLAANGIDLTNEAHAERARRELDIFALTSANANAPPLPAGAGIFADKLSMPGDASPNCLPFDKWLNRLAEKRQHLKALARLIGADDPTDLVEKVYAFIRPEYEPLKSGFGKNAHEYVAFALGAPRKTDRDPEFPDEFNLIFRGEGGRRARQIMIVPGPQLLLLLVQLVSQRAGANFHTTAKLSDLLDIFDAVGIDFRSNPDDFDNIKSELLRLGLLQSSADAAEAASLRPAYSLQLMA